MEELNIIVAKPTADVLRKVAEDAGIPIGEVVDRAVLAVAPDNPAKASIVALEQYLICVSRLNKKDSAKVFGDLCGIFLSSLPAEELDDMVSTIKSNRQSDKYAMEPLTEAESLALKKAVYDMLRMLKDENILKYIL